MTGAYSHFIGMKHLGVFLLPLDGLLVHRRITPPPSPLPPAVCHWYPFMHLGEERREHIKFR